jgi:tryptophanyl-tRNA synthetase
LADHKHPKGIVLTGIKPSGMPHLGNYLGMIRPAIALAEDYRAFYFIADLHALTSVTDPDLLRRASYEAAATFIALGLDPSRAILYRQSDLSEVAELSWILSCVAPKGMLNRAHAYKAATDANRASGKDPDHGVSAGLFNYPILMAADILLLRTDVVPVGLDQKQHLEIARDLAESFNSLFGPILKVPEPVIAPDVATVPGIDGRKMSKSYDNVIPLFGDSDVIRKGVMRIVTDSRSPDEPKNPDGCNVFALYRHFAPEDECQETRRRYLEGGIAYSEVKEALFHHLVRHFSGARATHQELLTNTDHLDRVLAEGAERARLLAREVMVHVREAVGLSPATAAVVGGSPTSQKSRDGSR